MTEKQGRPAEDGEEDLAELVSFPASPPTGEDLESDPDPDVVEAELVPVDEQEPPGAPVRFRGGALVPTGQLPEEIVLEGEIVDSVVLDRRFEPRPIVPAWVLDRAQRRMVLRWFTKHLGHTTAFHGVRFTSPLIGVIPRMGKTFAARLPPAAAALQVRMQP